MKDWETLESYFLPRILCFSESNNTLPTRIQKPNLRYFSLHEETKIFTPWERSDCFCPEMIPEPDYSDSADELGSDDEEGSSSSSFSSYPPQNTAGIERLRDVTEVYVRNVEVKRPKAKPASDHKDKPSKASDRTATSKPHPAKKAPVTKMPVEKSATKSDKPKQTVKVTDTKGKTPQTAAKPSEKPKTPPTAKKATASTKSAAQTTGETRKESPATKKKVTPPKKPTTGKDASSKATPAKGTKAKVPGKTTKDSPAGDTKSPPTRKQPKSPAKRSPAGDTKKTAKDRPKTPESPTSTEESEDEDELIKPKKPINPYLSSMERLQLHKELRFNQKYGKFGSSHKTELQLALEKYTENKERRNMLADEKTSLEKILELQARKIEMQENTGGCPTWMDRLQRPPTASDPKEDEFFRVHARVVSSNALTHCFLNSDEECGDST